VPSGATSTQFTDEFEGVKMMIVRLPSRAYVSRTVLMATASIWALFGVLALIR